MVWHCNVCRKDSDILVRCDEEIVDKDIPFERIDDFFDFRLARRCESCDSNDVEWR